MTPLRIGILGLGAVGQEVVDLLGRYPRANGGPGLVVTRAVARDVERHRARFPDLAIDDAPDRLISSDDVDVVVELIGGTAGPRSWIRHALELGKPVVTANKAVLAEHGDELFEVARAHRQPLLFEAAVAGAIPILQVLRGGFTAGPVAAVTAILNGSSNWLLGALADGRSRSDALAEATRLGLLESDPTLDLSGADAAHKLCLVARLLTRQRIPLAAVRCDGIAEVEPADLAFGARHGLTLKPVAVMRQAEAGVCLGVHPAFLPEEHALATVRSENNGLFLEGPTFGSLLLVGRGAGGLPTAGSVIADLERLSPRSRTHGTPEVDAAIGDLTVIDPLEDRAHRHYLRLDVADEPGVLAEVAGALARRDISIASVEQNEPGPDPTARIHLITHPCRISTLELALGDLFGPAFKGPVVRIPVDRCDP